MGKSGWDAGSGDTSSNCGPNHVASQALITSFSDAVPSTTSSGNYTFGSSGAAAGMVGGTSLYSSGKTGTLSVSGGMLTFTGTVPAPTSADPNPYNGFEVYVAGPTCISAGHFLGIEFTYMNTGACLVYFSFLDSQRVTPSSDPSRGTCVATSCYPDQFAPWQFSNGSQTLKIYFGGTTPVISGMPFIGVDPATLIGVEWQLGTADGTTPCTGTITVGDISFF